LISGTSEAVFQHLKIAFFAYILLNIIEYLIYKKSIEQKQRYLFSRLFSTLILPLAIGIFFFTAPAYYGKFQTIPAEIIFANIALLSASFCTIVIEDHFEKIAPSKIFQVVILILFLIMLSIFIIFSFKDPWFDVFAIPPGWE
jgi:hypothetical protein